MFKIQIIHVFQHVKPVLYCILFTDPPVFSILVAHEVHVDLARVAGELHYHGVDIALGHEMDDDLKLPGVLNTRGLAVQ